jgi:hypothetical protein
MAQWQKSFTREPTKTKAELREMLTEAVRNTQPEPKRPPKAKTDRCLERFAGLTWGGVDATRLSQFVLADAPLAAVRPHLQRRETPPALVDEIITITYRSLTFDRPTPTAGSQKDTKA